MYLYSMTRCPMKLHIWYILNLCPDQVTFSFLFPVGEPINADAWHWYNEVVGEKRCTVVDTWWQTGTALSFCRKIQRNAYDGLLQTVYSSRNGWHIYRA